MEKKTENNFPFPSAQMVLREVDFVNGSAGNIKKSDEEQRERDL